MNGDPDRRLLIVHLRTLVPLAALLIHSPALAESATLPSTRSAPAEQIDLLAMGDWGEGKPAQTTVAHALADYAGAHKGRFGGMLLAGDNFYVKLSGTDDPQWKTLFEQMYDPATLDMPFYAALGNHDYLDNKVAIEMSYARQHPESRWKLPGRWYRLDLPVDHPLVTVLMLDSNHDTLTPLQWNVQVNWLREQLTLPGRAPWTICCAHHPLYSNGAAADNGVLHQDWGTLFQKYGVDFYLCGHEHNLQHLEIPGKWTSFVLAGGGGAHAHPMLRDRRGPFSRSIYGFAHFEFAPDRAIVRFIETDDKPVHIFERSKAGDVRTVMTTPSDAAASKPLEVIQGIYDRARAGTRPASGPSTTSAP